MKAQGEAEAFGLAVGDADAVAVGDGQGVDGALVTAVAEGLAEPDAFGVAVGVGVGLGFTEPEGMTVGETQMVGPAVGASSVWLAGELVFPPPSRSRAAGTTNRPRMTVITKASAPHSWSQKARDEFRIRARRPLRAGVCCAY